MGKLSRDKGNRGQAEFRNLLLDRDWEIISEPSPGLKTDDLIARDEHGTMYSIEVKHHKIIDLEKFRRQAREQASKKKLPWMLAVRIPGHKSTFYVEYEKKIRVWE